MVCRNAQVEWDGCNVRYDGKWKVLAKVAPTTLSCAKGLLQRVARCGRADGELFQLGGEPCLRERGGAGGERVPFATIRQQATYNTPACLDLGDGAKTLKHSDCHVIWPQDRPAIVSAAAALRHRPNGARNIARGLSCSTKRPASPCEKAGYPEHHFSGRAPCLCWPHDACYRIPGQHSLAEMPIVVVRQGCLRVAPVIILAVVVAMLDDENECAVALRIDNTA
jgi:hypothetical protein